RFGPYLLNEVKEYLKTGNLRFSDLVWYDGVAEWLPLSSVPGVGEGVKTLHAAAPPPPKPPPAPAGPPQAPSLAGGPPQTAAQGPVFGGSDDEDDDYASLEGERKGIAGLGARTLALFVDVLLIATASAAVVGVVFWLHTMTNPNKEVEQWQLWAVPMVIAVIVGWLYSSLTESSAGMATLGKRMVKAQVCLEETDGRIGFGRATGRAFAKIIGVAGFFMIFTSRRRQTLHDMITGTIVRQSIDSPDDDFEDDLDEDDPQSEDT
ncbi:MAG: RDD family protein, partial [Opitutales bacterium]